MAFCRQKLGARSAIEHSSRLNFEEGGSFVWRLLLAFACTQTWPGIEQRAGSSLLSPQRAERLLKFHPALSPEAVELICWVSKQTEPQNWGQEHLKFLTSEVLGLHSLAGTGRGYSTI